ncbi:hypothetical protein FRC08_010395 [Ceratobasidium sp. 394]|nr:hypothetical protein FRC08_010395 [Ceratobasidium sp. 394]KAG9094203.1 hypothetical protein FS749_012940 [Ceratobasidium sp. UAMH 11750]
MAEVDHILPTKQPQPGVQAPTFNKAPSRKRILQVFCVAVVMFIGLRSLVPRRIVCRADTGGVRKIVQDAKMRLPSHFTLPSGDRIPSVALGTWQAPRGQVGEAVKVALKSGYRHIDGAWAYGNEGEVGQAIKESGISRKDLWLTSKLWNSFHKPEDVEGTLDETLERLQTNYLDLYLMHWPVAFDPPGPGGKIRVNHDLTENPLPTWKKLEEMVAKGKVRNIGVSNFNIRRLTNLTSASEIKIKPAINQVELNFFNPQPGLVKWSKDNGVLLEAYSPLGSNKQVGESLKNPTVVEIASQLGVTPAQVLISWEVQRGAVVLPKSITPCRIEENLQVFKLPDPLFQKLEKAAASHPPQRVVDPSKSWGVDIFEDEK